MEVGFQLNVIVKDMAATVDFYRRAGLRIEEGGNENHVEVILPNGVRLEFDTEHSVRLWDSGWNGETGSSGIIIGLFVETRESVDAKYAELTGAGYRGRQKPYDAFWGARYAIVTDPDGNGVGLMSPSDEKRKYWPPTPPP